MPKVGNRTGIWGDFWDAQDFLSESEFMKLRNYQNA
jgi:hypothetical protein